MSDIKWADIKTYLTVKHTGLLLLFITPIFVTLGVFFSDDSDTYAHLGNADYPFKHMAGSCQSGSRSGDSGATHGEITQQGVKFNIRTPGNYDSTVKHPLLVVFAPAGANRAKTEKMTGLTFPATSAGFIIAYADHPELSPTTTIDLGSIPEQVAKSWCVDSQRIYLTGHSDGGTAAMALAFMAGTQHIPTAIAPSAAGVSHIDLEGHECPDPISVMVMHSSKDRLFPNYGLDSSGWWAACNQCDPIPDQLDNGCIAYTGCKQNVQTWYCEGRDSHSHWPNNNAAMIDFFKRFGHPSSPKS